MGRLLGKAATRSSWCLLVGTSCGPAIPRRFFKLSRRSHDFVKPVIEGDESHRFRQIAAPTFNDRTHGSTWTEALGQAAALLKRWDSMQAPILQPNEEVTRLALQVIGFVCFDRQRGWTEAVGSRHNPPEGHRMRSY
ncbi:hypothetical protein HO173_010090 [Letharia columbiana]|uniref:Uncharacterized protein n=1 Tax=Letharia columbiana TaxID=112416 RepID=A0A8H6FNH0_9LECA|nr:uncharacterized protein HO173_010090 [Letharia columbiana]KAF6231788.1 hypothetical protein HO173_010090 [Letharia columbiana]